jgi:uncharacterized protein YdhG (YjbR/CyaY superfamily)
MVLKKAKKFETIDEYVSSFPKDVQLILEELREAIRDSAPDAKETISYQIPTFKLKGNLVHFAAFKNHIGFYPTPSAIKEFEEELSEYEKAKGSIKFPIKEPLPIDLIKEIVKFRVKENLGK